MPSTQEKSRAPASVGLVVLAVAAHLVSPVLAWILLVLIVGGDAGDIAQFYAYGGALMRPILSLMFLQAGPGIALSIAHLRRRPAPFAVYFVLPLAIVALGLLGMSLGILDAAGAIAYAPIAYVPSAVARGLSIAEITEIFGLIMASAALLPVMVVAPISIRRYRASAGQGDVLARSALGAALVGGATPLLFGLGVSFGRCRMAFARAMEAYADDGSIQPAIEQLGQAQGQMWIAVAIGLIVWGLMLWRAAPAFSRAHKTEPLISAGVVLVGLLGLVTMHVRGHRQIDDLLGPFGYPPELAALLGDDELAASVQAPRPALEGPLIRGWTYKAKERGVEALAVAPDGGVLMLGVDEDGLRTTAFVERFDVYGEVMWEQSWWIDGDDRVLFADLVLADDDKLVVRLGQSSGRQELRIYDLDGQETLRDALVVEPSDAGSLGAFALGGDGKLYLLTPNPAASEADGPPPFLLRSYGLDGRLVRELGLAHGGLHLAVDESGEILVASQRMAYDDEERALKRLPADAVPFSIEPSLHRFTADGTLRWDKTWGNGSCGVRGLAVGPDGTAHVVGTVDGPIDAAGPADAPADVYVASVDAAGESVRLQQFGSAQVKDDPRFIGVRADMLWIAGTRGEFGEDESVFVALRSPSGAAGEGFEWASTGGARLSTAALGADGVLYLAGEAEGDFERFEDYADEGWTFLVKWRQP